MSGKEEIRDFYGKILGYREDAGDRIIARDFYNRILGYYYKNEDVTKDFYNRIVAQGDATVGLIMSAEQDI